MKVKLRTDDYRPRSAEVIGYDSLLDLALIKVEDVQIDETFSIVSDQDLNEGDAVIAIGAPLGLVNTVTSGIVSSRSRIGLFDIGRVMQIDASVNPGNSGGPLVNKDKKVAGVIVAKLLGLENINFAIPGEVVEKVMPSLFAGDEVKHSWLGIGGYKVEKGLKVLYIAPNSSAEYSGINVNDIIVSVNGNPIEKIEDWQLVMLERNVGELLSVEVFRDGQADSEPTEEMFIVSESREQDIFDPGLNKKSFDKIFPVLSGANITVINNRIGNPKYRITEVFDDTFAKYLDLTAGDIIQLRKIEKNERFVTIVIKMLQQERGYLEDVIGFNLEISTKNFI